MASDKQVFPIIPSRVWADVRRQFARSMPGEVTPRYLATVLSIQERAAANLVPNLRRVGLIDDAGVPTERANLWRNDEHYSEVCHAILAEAYPQELRDALPPPNPDRDRVASWFARETKNGAAAASQQARFYCLLAKADPNEGADATAAASGSAAVRTGTRAISRPKRLAAGDGRSTPAAADQSRAAPPTLPTLQINVQVQIDAKASPEQIEQVFASMARHLYGRS